jgi:hypothetical protein
VAVRFELAESVERDLLIRKLFTSGYDIAGVCINLVRDDRHAQEHLVDPSRAAGTVYERRASLIDHIRSSCDHDREAAV